MSWYTTTTCAIGVAAGLALTLLAGCENSTATPPATPSVVAEQASAPAAETPPLSNGSRQPPRTEALKIETPLSDRTLAQTFDDIKFDIQPDAPFDREMLTDQIESLVGKRIAIRGYILPSARDKLRDFVLVRDDQECCFGPGAALYDCILVEMAPGEVADFSLRPVAVEGVFRVEPLDIFGQTRAVFRMTADKVE